MLIFYLGMGRHFFANLLLKLLVDVGLPLVSSLEVSVLSMGNAKV